MNRLTSVPTNIAPIIAMESGFCSSEPMSNENSSGTIAKMVVSDVMMMGRHSTTAISPSVTTPNRTLTSIAASNPSMHTAILPSDRIST